MKVINKVKFNPDERAQMVNAIKNLRLLAEKTDILDTVCETYFDDKEHLTDSLELMEDTIMDMTD